LYLIKIEFFSLHYLDHRSQRNSYVYITFRKIKTNYFL
jgi:hypothetical protein